MSAKFLMFWRLFFAAAVCWGLLWKHGLALEKMGSLTTCLVPFDTCQQVPSRNRTMQSKTKKVIGPGHILARAELSGGAIACRNVLKRLILVENIFHASLLYLYIVVT